MVGIAMLRMVVSSVTMATAAAIAASTNQRRGWRGSVIIVARPRPAATG